MKKIIIIQMMLMLGIVQSVNAQHPYIPIPEDSAVWISMEYNNIQPTAYSIGRTESVDTTFMTQKYFCYFGDYYNYDFPIPPVKQEPAKFAIWLRQDSLNRKVWFNRNHSIPSSDELLYDFSLQKGDTITDSNSSYFSPQLCYPYKAWVSDLDSLFWPDGKWHYRWTINTIIGMTTAKALMIEGMGYTSHFYYNPFDKYLHSYHYELCCYKSDMQWLYSIPNPWNADCAKMIDSNVVPVSVNDIYVNDLTESLLYPNPVKSYGALVLNAYAGRSNDVCIITAYDMTGRKMLTVEKKPGEKINMSEHTLTPGIYFFIVNNRQETIYRQKVIIE